MRLPLALLAAALLSSTALAQQPSQRADLCAELSDYVTKQQAPKPADSGPPAAQATAVQAPAKDGERSQPGGTDAPQQTSGMSGPVTHGGTGAPGPQGKAQESAPSGQPNPQAGGASQTASNRPPAAQPGQPAQPAGQQQAAANPPAAVFSVQSWVTTESISVDRSRIAALPSPDSSKRLWILADSSA